MQDLPENDRVTFFDNPRNPKKKGFKLLSNMNYAIRRLRIRLPLFLCLSAFVLAVTSGCGNSERDVAEERVRRIEKDVDRELERAEKEISELRDELEEKLDRSLTDEELEKISEEIETTVESGLESIGATLERIGGRLKEDSKVTVIDYRDFKELLPEEVEGFKRTNVEGSNKNALGIRFSVIEAQYENSRNDLTMELAISDLGTMKGITSMGFDWLDREIDSKNVDGFERTTKFGGYPGFESAEYEGSNVKTHGVVIVENRFVVVVNVEGEDVDKNILTKVFDEFSFRRLRKMAN